MPCNKCGHTVSETDRYCERCGTEINTTHRKLPCNKCDHTVSETHRYCERCGAEINTTDREGNTPLDKATAKPDAPIVDENAEKKKDAEVPGSFFIEAATIFFNQ